ncbi:unnamed protein product [Camellia sinensis]
MKRERERCVNFGVQTANGAACDGNGGNKTVHPGNSELGNEKQE